MHGVDANLIAEAIIYLIALVLSICVHEFGHAIVADKLGDKLPRAEGRVTLNPVAHADPVGTLLIPFAMFLMNAAGGHGVMFGWGKPVRTNPSSYTRKVTMRRGHMLVAAAGPAMNFVFAVVLSIVLVVLARAEVDRELLVRVAFVIQMNFVLMIFNLLPVPPLDGGTVLAGILPRRYLGFLAPLERYGFLILIGLMLTGLLRFALWPAYALTIQWFRLLGV